MSPPNDNPYAPPSPGGGEPPVLAQPVQESESVLRVDYELTLDDLVEFNFYHFNHSAAYRRRLWLMRILALTVALVVTLGLFAGVRDWTGALAFLLVPGIFVIFLVYATLPSRRKASLRSTLEGMFREGRNANLFSLHRVWISPTGIRRISRYTDTTYQWPVVEKIVATEQGVYIYDSAASAILVPRSAFADQGDFDRFVETARQFWQAAERT